MLDLDALDGAPQPPRVLLVNLNLRAVTAGGGESLVEKQLGAMLGDALLGAEPAETSVRFPRR